MTSIGIIANPASGKDIRRLLSHATTIDNYEKLNIVERIILGAQAFGVDNVIIMPDAYNLGYRVEEKLKINRELNCKINVIDMLYHDNATDTINSVKYMEESNVGCIVILGGDGTNRAVAKVIKTTPIISISTGTNNVYPVMIEGTIAGIAAAVVASNSFEKKQLMIKDKQIEIFKDDKLIDIALIDAVVTKDIYIGAKAIYEMDKIEKVFVTRSHPASIGFSSIVGCKKVIKPEDNFGAYMDVNTKGNKILVPVAAGIISLLSVNEPFLVRIDEKYKYVSKNKGTVALDGEKEIEFSENENITFKITRNGPYHVNVKSTLEIAQINGFFNL